MQEEYGALYTELYQRHWWWRAREVILLREISRLELPDRARILDVGCGNGLFLPRLSEFGEVFGIETDQSLLSEATPMRDRIRTEPLGSAEYEGLKFDLIVALDVLEHIEDDARAAASIAEMLEPDGRCLITVPAMMSLWDVHDEINQHFRRYDRRGLRELLTPHFEIERMRYFFHGIYVPKRLVAALNLSKKAEVDQTRIPGEPINSLLKRFCILEYSLTAGARLPFGSSLLARLSPR